MWFSTKMSKKTKMEIGSWNTLISLLPACIKSRVRAADLSSCENSRLLHPDWTLLFPVGSGVSGTAHDFRSIWTRHVLISAMQSAGAG